MSKFKVGDRVKRVARDHCGMSVGDTATIRKLHPCQQTGMHYLLNEFDGIHGEDKLELFKFTKADLKDGMRVETHEDEYIAAGQKWLSLGRLGNDGQDILYVRTDSYSDDLKNAKGMKYFDVVKVTDRDGTVLFERPPVKRKIELELTDEQYEAVKRQFDL